LRLHTERPRGHVLGTARPTLDLVAHAVLSPYAVERKRQAVRGPNHLLDTADRAVVSTSRRHSTIELKVYLG
jgi:hypothetical protein